MACVPNVDLAALTGFYIHMESLVLNCLWLAEKTRNFLVRQAYRLDVVSGQYSADSVEYGPSIE
jgi:hypothetical protein